MITEKGVYVDDVYKKCCKVFKRTWDVIVKHEKPKKVQEQKVQLLRQQLAEVERRSAATAEDLDMLQCTVAFCGDGRYINSI